MIEQGAERQSCLYVTIISRVGILEIWILLIHRPHAYGMSTSLMHAVCYHPKAISIGLNTMPEGIFQ